MEQLRLSPSVILHDISTPVSTLETIISIFSSDHQFDDELALLLSNSTQKLRNVIKSASIALQDCKDDRDRTLDNIFSSCLNELSFAFEDNNINTKVFISGRYCFDIKEFVFIKSAIFNLLKNSIEAFYGNYTKNERYITLTGFITEFEITISVKDNAGGINDLLLEEVFKPGFSSKGFMRGSGLAIVKDNIEGKLGGRVSVYTKQGVGSIFELKIKRRQKCKTQD